MKYILITGNSGYIGSHLTKLLSQNDNYRLFGLDLVEPNIPVSGHYSLDIRKPEQLPTSQFDCVIHLAALVNVGESERDPKSYYDTNLIGTMNVLNKIHTKNFIFASTGAAEKCESAYGISKRAAEDVVRQHCTKNSIDYTMFRFYNVIGSDGIKPTNPDGLFYNLIKAIDTKEFTLYGNDYNTSDGTCIRDYVHVLEICNAIDLAIKTPSNTLENLGHGKGNSVQQMVDLFKKVNNVDFTVINGPRRKGDIETSVLDNPSKYMKNLFSFEQLLKVDN
jgi:UDP-glucose 4-epimerase